MPFLALAAGFLMAFFASMPPVGPVAVLLLQRGVAGRQREGVAIGIGAALAESVYIAFALAGLSALMSRYPVVETVSRIAGVVLLLGLGVYFSRFKQKPIDSEAPPSSAHVGKPFLLGLTVSAANPILILTWSASIATLLSLAHMRFELADKVAFVAGAFSGMLAWFCLFLAGLMRYRDRITLRAAEWAVRIAGVALIAMAIYGAALVLRA